jgi:acylphosphatase
MVQGVGFRFTARHLANKYKLKGWAKNLYDGKVEVEIEGDQTQVNKFLGDIQEEFRNYIKDIESEELPFSGEHTDFQIKF